MTRFGLVAALAMLTGALAHAQGVFEPVVPKPLPDSTMGAPTELPDTQTAPPPRPPRNEMRAQRDADARHCLELPTNRQIHRCAERYRAHVARVRAARAAKAEKAAVATAPAKAATIAPPVAPAAPAKSVEAPKPGDKGTLTIKPMDTGKSGAAPSTAASGTDIEKTPGPPKLSDVMKPIPPAKPQEPTKK